MAKKGATAQLQTSLQTDEELERFLDNTGLCDIYSDWCGPCLGMVTALRKAKMEIGGDTLYLAICKADTIEAFARFRNKSEPTWLFVTKGKTINIMFGSEIPKLIKLITYELNRFGKASYPDAVSLRELLPIEKERVAKIQAAAEKIRFAKEREIKKKRLEYLNYCTAEIISFTSGFGVTLFGPHIDRDQLKKVLDIADGEKLSCKDRRAFILLPEHIEVLHYACNNPISEEALEQMYGKELLACYWKMPDDDKRTVEDILTNFVGKLIKTNPTDDGENAVPPILQSLEIKVKGQKEEVEPDAPEIKSVTFNMLKEEQIEEVTDEDDVIGDGEEMDSIESLVVKKSSSFLYIANVPAMWTPANRKTTAAAIYVFFRNQTTGFLPPDPIPEPPHLIVVFDAWKRKDVTDVMNKYTDEILGYGYFTTEEPETAKLIANSNVAYSKKKANRLDKLVLKVAKKTSNAVLALASHGPTYVSPNTDIGKTEALRFFPEGYNSEEIVEPEPAAPAPKKEKENTKMDGDKQKSKGEKLATEQKAVVEQVENVDGEQVENADGEQVENADDEQVENTADEAEAGEEVTAEGNGPTAEADGPPAEGDTTTPKDETPAEDVAAAPAAEEAPAA